MASIANEFEILSRVYLEPFVESHPLFWIGVYERLATEVVNRVYIGPKAPCELFPLGKGNVGWVAQTGIRKNVSDVKLDPQYSECFRETKSEWVEPIVFGEHAVGVIDAESDLLNAFARLDANDFKAVADQLAPLFAWTESPWSARLECLRLLNNLKEKNSECNWVGIYRKHPAKEERLLLSTFIGAPTEHIEIPISEGICGAAFREEKTINVPNTLADPRFIACSLSTQSEIVVPIRNRDGLVVAELDIDSDTPEAFTPELTAKVEACAQEIEQIAELWA